MTTRRQFLHIAGGVGLLGATGALGLLRLGPTPQTGVLLRSQRPLPDPYRTSLTVPPVAQPSTTNGYQVTMRAADLEILPGTTTRIWGYDGIFPGPTFRIRRGQPVDVTFRNELSIATVVHLHGGRTPPDSDGYPTDLILPADGTSVHHTMLGDTTIGERTYHYPLDQRAATLWYHDHAMDFTGPNVTRGLAGMFIVTDDEDEDLPLPRGDHELPLIICDRAFDADGQIRYPALSPEQHHPGVEQPYMAGVLADTILVNGQPWPHHPTTRRRYRLRLLNASNARRYELALDPPHPAGAAFTQIGTDGGLLEHPLARQTITLAPGERVDAIVDFAAYPTGTNVELVNRLGTGTTRPVMRFDLVRDEPDDTTIPDRLTTHEPLHRADVRTTRTFNFKLHRADNRHPGHYPDAAGNHRWTINGRTFDPDYDYATPRLDDTEIWRFTTDLHHPIHLHLVHFKVLTRNNRDPKPGDLGWKDTIDLIPGETAEIITRFDGYPGRYVFHCHNLEHEDMAMMANFNVVAS